eukprot:scaffold297_cov108-Isochrysis_galbana.AAC.23
MAASADALMRPSSARASSSCAICCCDSATVARSRLIERACTRSNSFLAAASVRAHSTTT